MCCVEAVPNGHHSETIPCGRCHGLGIRQPWLVGWRWRLFGREAIMERCNDKRNNRFVLIPSLLGAWGWSLAMSAMVPWEGSAGLADPQQEGQRHAKRPKKLSV